MTGCGRLALGTAQWGLTGYGIASRGRPAAVVVSAMLQLAGEHGIDLVDTAFAYGDAEAVVGSGLPRSAREFHIVTKTMPVPSPRVSEADVAAVTAAFAGSLERLQVRRAYGLLVHGSHDLLKADGERLWQALEALRGDGKVQKIGVSVYHPEQLDAILQRFPIDLVQLPLNIYDQRFIRTGLLASLQRAQVEVHVRSVFLQGLLLMEAGKLPEYFEPLREHHASFHAKARNSGISIVSACVRFCLAQRPVNRVIVGCESVEQLSEIIAAATADGAGDAAFTDEGLEDVRFLDPSRWPKAAHEIAISPC